MWTDYCPVLCVSKFSRGHNIRTQYHTFGVIYIKSNFLLFDLQITNFRFYQKFISSLRGKYFSVKRLCFIKLQ